MSKRKMQRLVEYLRERISDFDLRVELAVNHIMRDGWRLQNVDNGLALDIEEFAEEFAEDYSSPLPEDFDVHEFVIQVAINA